MMILDDVIASTKNKKDLYLDLIQILLIQINESKEICKNLFSFYKDDLLPKFLSRNEFYRKSEQNKLNSIFNNYLNNITHVGDPSNPVLFSPSIPSIDVTKLHELQLYELLKIVSKLVDCEQSLEFLKEKYSLAVQRILPFVTNQETFEQFISRWEK